MLTRKSNSVVFRVYSDSVNQGQLKAMLHGNMALRAGESYFIYN
jgi:hypothetical protein